MTTRPFWDRIAPKNARKPVVDPAAYEAKLAQVGALLQATDHVLEIGCGTGSTALRLAPGVAHYTATDGAQGMIDVARSKLRPGSPAKDTSHKKDGTMRKIETNTLLSTLWLFILLNIVFRDIHQLVLKSELEMLLTGTYNGVEITERLMLLGGIMVQVPIGMVLFSLLLTRRISRPVTFVAVLITGGGLLSAAPTDPDDVLHLVIELAAMTAILWTTWKWSDDSPSAVLGETS